MRLLPRDVACGIDGMALGREAPDPVALETDPASWIGMLAPILGQERARANKTLPVAVHTAFEVGRISRA